MVVKKGVDGLKKVVIVGLKLKIVGVFADGGWESGLLVGDERRGWLRKASSVVVGPGRVVEWRLQEKAVREVGDAPIRGRDGRDSGG
jgi:hypothetical protein